MTTARKASKHEVHLLDFTPLTERAKEFINQNRSEDKQATACTVRWTLGYIETNEGLFILDNDGVGNNHPITADKPYGLEIYGERTYINENGKEVTAFDMMPSCRLQLSDKTIRQYDTSERLYLDEFIRTFGDRLEHNYYTWEQLLNGEQA